jgi:MFS family permease
LTPLQLMAGGMLAMAAAFGFGRFVYTPILPHMIAAGLGPSAAGFIAAMNYLGYLAGALLGATGIMQARARAWFLLSLAVSGLSMIAMAFTRDVMLSSLLRFLGGAGGSIVMVTGATLFFQPLLATRSTWLAMAPFCGVGLGIAASSLIVSALALGGASWPAMWIVTGLVATLAIGAIAALVPAPKPAAAAAPDAPAYGAVAWSHRLGLLILSYGLFGFGYVITATFIVVITRETPALAALEPFVWIIVGLAGAASIPVWSSVARAFGDVAAYALACLAEAAGVALSVVAPTPAAIVASAVLVGGTFMAITALGLQVGRRLATGAPQKIQAIMTAAFGIGQVVGPLVAGHLRETAGTYLASSLAAAAALVIGAALALVP